MTIDPHLLKGLVTARQMRQIRNQHRLSVEFGLLPLMLNLTSAADDHRLIARGSIDHRRNACFALAHVALKHLLYTVNNNHLRSSNALSG